MKKKGTKQWMAVLTVLLAAMFMIISVGCGAEKKEIVDETDMSRWVVRFSSNYECDLQNKGEDAEIWGWEEKTVAELREMHISDCFFVRQKTIFPAQLSGQDIHFVIRAVKRLAHCLYDSIVGQSCSKMIDRLHGVALLFVF